MSLETDGVWKAGVWASTVWGDCVWSEPGCVVAPAPAPAPTPVVTNEPAGGGGKSGGWPSRDVYRKKRQAILEEDEEIMRLCALALPELIKHFRKR